MAHPAPKPKDEYTQYCSGHILHRYIPRLEQRLQHAAIFCVRHWLAACGDINAGPRGLLAVREAFNDDPQPEIQETLGMPCQARGNAAAARGHYENAIRGIQNDPGRNHTVPPWSETITRLNQRIQ